MNSRHLHYSVLKGTPSIVTQSCLLGDTQHQVTWHRHILFVTGSRRAYRLSTLVHPHFRRLMRLGSEDSDICLDKSDSTRSLPLCGLSPPSSFAARAQKDGLFWADGQPVIVLCSCSLAPLPILALTRLFSGTAANTAPLRNVTRHKSLPAEERIAPPSFSWRLFLDPCATRDGNVMQSHRKGRTMSRTALCCESMHSSPSSN